MINPKRTYQLRKSSLSYGTVNSPIKISKETLDNNTLMLDFENGAPCPKCHMLMDIGERGPCKYCIGDW
jgi:hypothetical protein